jgi:3-methyl-2-oxobutanoate hydroxymethyltransferase
MSQITLPERTNERITVPRLVEFKQEGRKIVVVTAYDYPSARLADRAGIDVILVGDTLGMMALGYKTTVPVSLEEMIHHAKAAKRGIKTSLMVVDLPFGTYQASPQEAYHNAARLLKEAGAHAVKLEGGANMAETVRLLTQGGIPVMGHVGLTPQSVHVFGGNKVQGRTPDDAEQILHAAQVLQDAGAFALVLEAIPVPLARRITQAVSIPTIGIGAGVECDGQVQVWHDLFGIFPGRPLRHTKVYADMGALFEQALRHYAEEVRTETFPTEENSH